MEPVRCEINELTDLVSAIQMCGRTMQAATEMLHSAPKIMLEKMQSFYPRDGAYYQLVSRFLVAQGQLGQRLESSQAHLQAMNALIGKMLETNYAINQTFTQRDQAYSDSAHYDKKVEQLRSVLLRSSGNMKLHDKVSRNEQKRFDHQQAFQQISDETQKSASVILSRKLQETGEAVAHLCRFYSGAFDGAAHVAEELASLAQGFSRPSTAEEVMRRGRDYATQAADRGREFMSQATSGEGMQQAKEKMSGFASSTKERFSNIGSSTSSTWQSNFGGGGARTGSARGQGQGTDGSGDMPPTSQGNWGQTPPQSGGSGSWPTPSFPSWTSNANADSQGYANGGGFTGASSQSPWDMPSGRPAAGWGGSPGNGSSGRGGTSSPWESSGPNANSGGAAFGGFGGDASGGSGGGYQGGTQNSPWDAPVQAGKKKLGSARQALATRSFR